MPINYDTVKTNLYNWAVSVLPAGMPVIFWEPNAPRPTVSYATLYLSSILATGQDWTENEADANGIVDMKGDRQFTLSFQVYGGPSPLTVLENVRSSLQKQTVLDTLRANGIVFFQSLNILDITDLIDSRWEMRASMDILFGIGQTYTDNPGYFDHMIVQEIINDVDGSVVINTTFPIPQT